MSTSMPARVRDRLLKGFEERGLRAGDKIPTEAEIAAAHDVGRSTAREALKLLEQEGLISVRHGRGRFLTPLGTYRIERPVTRFEPVSVMLREMGFDAQVLVLGVVEALASEDECERLALEPDAPVVRVDRLRSDGETPLVVSHNVIPRELVPGPLKHVDWSRSMNDMLAAHGRATGSSVARIRATELPSQLLVRHHLEGLGPWLLFSETVVTTDGLPVMLSEDYHRGDRFTFHAVRR